MRLPQFLNQPVEYQRYNVASLAAASKVLTAPAGLNVLAAAAVHGATGIVLSITGDSGSLGPSCDLAASDMTVETNELVSDLPDWIPIGERFQPGEGIDILSTSLTLAAEISLYVLWSDRPIPGWPRLRYKRFTYTNTTDNESLGYMPKNAQAIKLATLRGVDLEASEILVGGSKKGIGFLPGRQASALNDIILPSQWIPVHVPGASGAEISTGQHNHGTGGASDLFLGYTWS